MAIGIILAIIFAVSIFFSLFAMCRFFEDADGYSSSIPHSRAKGNLSMILAIVLALAFLVVPFSFRTVSSGEVAVVKVLGKIEDVRTAGTYWDLWVTRKYVRYDTKVQNVETVTSAYSSDAQTMDVEMTIQYQIIADKVVDIATQYGSLDVLQSRIEAIAIEKTKSVLSSYKAMDIIGNRAAISPAVEEAIKEAVGEEYFVNIVATAITNIDFSDAFEQAVEEKMIAEQAKLKAEYENASKIAKAEADAEAKLKAATAEIQIAEVEAEAQLKAATAKIEIAKKEAEALKIAAQAEAEANKIIMESLTDEIIKKILADSWNGELPAVVGSSDYILPTDILQ